MMCRIIGRGASGGLVRQKINKSASVELIVKKNLKKMWSSAQEGDVAQSTNFLFIYFFQMYRWSSAQEGDVDSIRALHSDSPGFYFQRERGGGGGAGGGGGE
jgi:hypothetical protein